MGTDAGQHAGKQIKLVWNKRINLCKIFCVSVQFFLHTVVEDNQIFDDGRFLVIEQTQALCCGLCLIQNTLFDNSVYIGRGQRKACIETSMNLGEVEITSEYNTTDGSLEVDFEGEDMGILIGKRGQTLDSLQYLTSLVVNKGKSNYIRVKLDTEDYRKRRKETLENLARGIAYKVRKTRKPVILEPMNP